MSNTKPSTKPKGMSLHIGLNRVDPGHYQGWSGDLHGCENDANDLAAIAKAAGFTTSVLLTEAGTTAAVQRGIGAAAVVAPLWSIDDVAAKELALRFYTRVFRDGVPPATVLRDERCTYAGPGCDGAATRLAYQYFGHPALTLRSGMGRAGNGHPRSDP